jgi:NAD+ synthase
MELEYKISKWLKNYLEDHNFDCFVVGVSGGIDSSLVSTLCAITGKKTIVVSLPINQEKNQLNRANKHINWLKKKYSNVESIDIDLSNSFKSLSTIIENPSKLSLANSKSRLRMVSLYLIASNKNGIVVGTGNKIEDFGIGFFTKYGDGGVDISPIADLYKSEVFELSKKLGIDTEIINAKPTDGLWDDDRTDEDQIGASYDELEWAMNELKMNDKIDNSKLTDRQIKVLNIYEKLNTVNKHKMIPIPIFLKNE